MDIVRAKKRPTRRYLFIAVGVLAVGFVTVYVSRLEGRPPTVDRGTLWIDSVRRGTMLRQVRAPGTLQPEHVRFVSALTAGRVERRPLKPGAIVMPSTVIVELSNPDVQLEALSAEKELAAAQSTLLNTQTQIESQRLTMQATLIGPRF